MSSLVTPTNDPALKQALLHLVNEVLPTLRLSAADTQPVTVDTPLFEKGRIDSMAILHVIGLIEEYTGQTVPDELVSMQHFYSIATIAQTFAPAVYESSAGEH